MGIGPGAEAVDANSEHPGLFIGQEEREGETVWLVTLPGGSEVVLSASLPIEEAEQQAVALAWPELPQQAEPTTGPALPIEWRCMNSQGYEAVDANGTPIGLELTWVESWDGPNEGETIQNVWLADRYGEGIDRSPEPVGLVGVPWDDHAARLQAEELAIKVLWPELAGPAEASASDSEPSDQTTEGEPPSDALMEECEAIADGAASATAENDEDPGEEFDPDLPAGILPTEDQAIAAETRIGDTPTDPAEQIDADRRADFAATFGEPATADKGEREPVEAGLLPRGARRRR